MIEFKISAYEYKKIYDFVKTTPDEYGGNRPGNIYQKTMGFAGEVGFKKLFDIPFDLKARPDNGFDMPYKNLFVAIKTSEIKVKDELRKYVAFPKFQINEKHNFFVFLSCFINPDHTREFKVITAMFKKDFLEISINRKEGEPLNKIGNEILYKDKGDKIIYEDFACLTKYMNKIETKEDLIKLLDLSNEFQNE